jgi:HSP20 family protein
MDRLFEESFIRPSSRLLAPLSVGDVALDMYETDDEVVVMTAVPGVIPEDLDITIAGDTLSIKGETKIEGEVKRESYIRQERRYGVFSRSVELPGGLDTDKAEATFENGVLTLRVPKLEEVKPKTIKVEAKTAE